MASSKLEPFLSAPITIAEIQFVDAILTRRVPYADAYVEFIARDKSTASRRTLEKAASRILNRPRVIAYARELKAAAISASRAEYSRIVAAACSVALCDLTTIFNEDGSVKHPKEWSKDVKASVDSIEVEEVYGMVEDEHGNKVKGVVGRKFKARTSGVRLQAIALLMKFRKMLGNEAGADLLDSTNDRVNLFVEPDNQPPAPE